MKIYIKFLKPHSETHHPRNSTLTIFVIFYGVNKKFYKPLKINGLLKICILKIGEMNHIPIMEPPHLYIYMNVRHFDIIYV